MGRRTASAAARHDGLRPSGPPPLGLGASERRPRSRDRLDTGRAGGCARLRRSIIADGLMLASRRRVESGTSTRRWSRETPARLLHEVDDQESSALKEPDDDERQHDAEHEEEGGACPPVATLLIRDEAVVGREEQAPDASEERGVMLAPSREMISTLRVHAAESATRAGRFAPSPPLVGALGRLTSRGALMLGSPRPR